MPKLLFGSVVLVMSSAAFGADLSPALTWATTTGGSGNNSVTAAAADDQGNLYIAGSTTSLDLPTIAATQAVAGGSVLARIDLPTGSGSRLYPANLPPITAAAAALSKPGTLYAASGSQIWQSSDAGSTWAVVSRFR